MLIWPTNESMYCGHLYSGRVAGCVAAASLKRVMPARTEEINTIIACCYQSFGIEAEHRTGSDEVRSVARLENSAPIVVSFQGWLESE